MTLSINNNVEHRRRRQQQQRRRLCLFENKKIFDLIVVN